MHAHQAMGQYQPAEHLHQAGNHQSLQGGMHTQYQQPQQYNYATVPSGGEHGHYQQLVVHQQHQQQHQPQQQQQQHWHAQSTTAGGVTAQTLMVHNQLLQQQHQPQYIQHQEYATTHTGVQFPMSATSTASAVPSAQGPPPDLQAQQRHREEERRRHDAEHQAQLAQWQDQVRKDADYLECIVPSYFTIDSLIGRGTYGMVFGANDARLMGVSIPRNNKTLSRDLHKEVALKHIREYFSDDVARAKNLQLLYREIFVLQKLNHPTIQPLLDAFLYYEPPISDGIADLVLVTPRISHNLEQFRRVQTDGKFPVQIVRVIAAQLIAGLDHMHQAGVIHRDIKPSNILVNDQLQINIIDFGQSREFEEVVEEGKKELGRQRQQPPRSSRQQQPGKAVAPASQKTMYVVTRWYRSPEILLVDPTYGPPADVWSIGCTLAELALGRVLFEGSSAQHQLETILDHVPAPPPGVLEKTQGRPERIQDVVSHPGVKQPLADILYEATGCNEFVDLVVRMLTFTPGDRITAAEALHHPFVVKKTQQIGHYPYPERPKVNISSMTVPELRTAIIGCVKLQNRISDKQHKEAMQRLVQAQEANSMPGSTGAA